MSKVKKAWMCECNAGQCVCFRLKRSGLCKAATPTSGRFVPEAEWRKVMMVVRAAINSGIVYSSGELGKALTAAMRRGK